MNEKQKEEERFRLDGESGEGSESVGFLGFIDGILRHREGYFQDVFENRQVGRQIGRLLVIIALLSGFYGIMMGTASGWRFMVASAIKVPILFLVTLLICYPVLYVVNVLMGSRLNLVQSLALILLALGLNSILLASCAPIVVFFTLTGTNYHFLKLLHVAIYAFSGIWGMIALWRGLQAMCESSNLYPRQAIRILRIWVLVFGFVGSQMAWSLRPFVGDPGLPFQLFRQRGGNFYTSVWDAAAALTGQRQTPNRTTGGK
jgi:hypothetical protein